MSVMQDALSRTSASELDAKALQAFIIARRKFVPVARLRAVLDALARWDEGGRGYLVSCGVVARTDAQFPHGFRWSCDSAGEKPPWCGA